MAELNAAPTVEEWLRGRIAALLGRPASQVDVNRRFVELGIESMEATTMSIELEDWLGVSLPLTLLWDHPTIASLAAHLETLRETAPTQRESAE